MAKVTKVSDLIALLQECDPDGTVALSLDGALLSDEDEPGEIEYSFEPFVDLLFSQRNTKQSDCVCLSLSHEDTKRLVASRRFEEKANSETTTPSANPAIAMSAPVAIAIALGQETYDNLLVVVESCNRAHDDNKGATTHGKLNVPKLLTMFAEDAAMTNSRPGSWEGANMQQVLDSHGYR
jgi:hypothetical protein